MAKRIVLCKFRYINATGLREVQYNSPKDYAYYTDDDTIKVDDYCVVNVRASSPSISGLQVVKVVGVQETVEAIAKVFEWIIVKVPMDEYNARLEKQDKLKLLEVKIRKATEDARRMIEFEKLAETLPELKELVAEFKALSQE
jgi:hypothetical protein